MAYWFYPGQEMDYQRPDGRSIPFLGQYRNIGYCNFGAVSAAAGYTFDEALKSAGAYTRLAGRTKPTDTPDGVPADAVKLIMQGWNDATDDKWSPTKSGHQ